VFLPKLKIWLKSFIILLDSYTSFTLLLRFLLGRRSSQLSRFPISDRRYCFLRLNRGASVRFCFPSRCSTAKSLFWTRGLISPREWTALSTFLDLASNAYTLIDIGCNTGLYSLAMACDCDSRSLNIYCFDILEESLQILDSNIASNDLHTKPSTFNLGVGTPRTIYLPASISRSLGADLPTSVNLSHSVPPDSFAPSDSIAIPIVSLSTIFNIIHLNEGYEGDILLPESNLLSIFRPHIICEVLPTTLCNLPCLETLLRDLNYTIYMISELGLIEKSSIVPDSTNIDWYFSPSPADIKHSPLPIVSCDLL
jgi:hypothetical protein